MRHTILDFDGTIIGPESLPFLAAIALHDRPDKDSIVAQIEAITQLGMNGEIPFEVSLSQRLALMRPSHNHIQEASQQLRTEVSASLRRNTEFITRNRDGIHIVSGGFREIILPVVEDLGFDPAHIYGNTFIFDEAGFVIGVDTENPLSRSGGKVELVRSLELGGNVFMIGDGKSDYEVAEAGLATFIAATEFVRPRAFVTETMLQAKNFDEVIAILARGNGVERRGGDRRRRV